MSIGFPQHPPPMGVLKLNFDASIKDNTTTIAYMIRDCSRSFVQAGGKKISHSIVPNAELTMAWNGIKISIYQICALHLLVEGDSLIATGWLNNNMGLESSENLFIQDIISWRILLHTLSFHHIYQEAN